jgi:Kef-type K+ transport system membrane component KefB
MAISVCGVVLPFGLGLILAPLILPHLEVHAITGLPVPATGFALFLGTALSITAMPVLGRILLELGITRTRLAAITISAAAFGDATGWILLFSVAAVVRGEFTLSAVGLMAAETIAFALTMVYVVRPLVIRWARSALRRGDGEIKINDLAILLILLMAAAVATNLIGIFAIFGAFFFGAILSSDSEFRQAINRRLRDFVTVFFLPIFFAYTGLRTNIGLLDSGLMWLFFGVLLAAAMIGKFGGCALAARWSGFSWRESACIGTMMNARGLMELVVVNLGYEMKVIPGSVFCMLVLMALITTVMTTPALGRLMWGTELEAPILASGLVRKRAAAVRAADDGPRKSLRA